MIKREFKIFGKIMVIDTKDLTDEEWKVEKSLITLGIEEKINSEERLRLHLSFPDTGTESEG